jgi:protein-disulfide isomerase
MNERASESASTTRRTLLAGLTTGVAVGLAGCFGGGTDSSNGGQSGSGTGETGTAGGTLPAPAMGDPNADVRVIVFEDFACPHCRDFTLNVVPQLQSEYIEPGTVRYEFHDFPIPVHDEISWEAACAARAVQASESDAAFFEYADALFENQRSLGPATYEQLATDMGLDGAAIRQSAVNREHEATVRADRQLGQEAGVQGTPTVVVGQQGVRPSYDAISSAIEGQLSGNS